MMAPLLHITSGAEVTAYCRVGKRGHWGVLTVLLFELHADDVARAAAAAAAAADDDDAAVFGAIHYHQFHHHHHHHHHLSHVTPTAEHRFHTASMQQPHMRNKMSTKNPFYPTH